MSAKNFHEGPLPQGFTYGFEPALFNTLEFLRLSEPAHLVSFYVLDFRIRQVVAAMHVQLVDESAQSPHRAPFGSVEANSRINPRVLYDFLTFVERRLKLLGAGELLIKNPPRSYDPDFVSLLETFLINHDFLVAIAEPGTVIRVRNAEFTEGIADSELYRKKQATSAGLEFQILPPGDIGKVYDFIAACHQEKGYKISISREQLRQTVATFPDRYLLSVVKEEGVMRAAAVSIRVKQNVLYNFLVNHEKDFNRLSPPILLMEGLYRYCQQNGIQLLDLGTSALAGKPKFSLLAFKMRMGASPTSKFSFYKKIS